MNTKSASEIVMEAVANSDTVTIQDMEKLDIRDKIVFNHQEGGAHCAYCLLGLDHERPSELEKIIDFANMSKGKEENRPSKTIEKIYYNEVASVEAITGFINMSTEQGMFNAVMSMVSIHRPFKLKLMIALAGDNS